MTPEQKAIAEAFKAGAQWARKNDYKFSNELNYDADFYVHTGVVREHKENYARDPRYPPYR